MICVVIVLDDMPVRRSSNHIPSSPVQDLQPPMKQGIVTILGADCDRNTKAGSIRKTLSADMSSKKWLQQNGFFSPIKKIVSSQEIAMAAADHSSSSESEEELDDSPNQDDVWRAIHERNEMQKPPPTQSGVWGSILTQKSDNSLLPPPYVFPSVKRSASSLSDKSLEICTESLGSETGTDCFSVYGAMEGLRDGGEEREGMQRSEVEEVKGEDPFADLHVVKYKNSPVRPFPPPLPSIAGSDGASLRMHSHRENGRLVLEAVSVAPRNYFHAQRQDGRLVLTLLHGPTNLGEEQEKSEFQKVFDDMEAVGEDVEEAVDRGGGSSDDGWDVVEEEEEEGESGGEKQESVVEQNQFLPTGMISVHKSGLVMKKLVAVGNINPKWSSKFNKGDDVMTRDGEQELPILQSLPPRPPVARLITSSPPPAAASFNAYEYFWRNKSTAIPGGLVNPMVTNKNKINQDLVVMRASKTEQSYMRGCKEARRSLIWEPYCIATS